MASVGREAAGAAHPDPLFRAAAEGNAQEVKQLLGQPGSHVNARDSRGRTPLSYGESCLS